MFTRSAFGPWAAGFPTSALKISFSLLLRTLCPNRSWTQCFLSMVFDNGVSEDMKIIVTLNVRYLYEHVIVLCGLTAIISTTFF